MKNIIKKSSGIFLLLFGAVSLFMTLSIFFDLFGIREKEGNYILPVVWANFFCAILYLVAGYGFFTNQKWTQKPLGISFIILTIAYLVLALHIKDGGLYETKTVIAMAFRTGITFILFLVAFKTFESVK